MQYKRSRFEIVFDILIFIKSKNDGVRSTHILYRANLSPDLLKKYLNAMKHDKLIRSFKSKNGIRYKITKKGLEFIKILDHINKMTHIIELMSNDRKNSTKLNCP